MKKLDDWQLLTMIAFGFVASVLIVICCVLSPIDKNATVVGGNWENKITICKYNFQDYWECREGPVFSEANFSPHDPTSDELKLGEREVTKFAWKYVVIFKDENDELYFFSVRNRAEFMSWEKETGKKKIISTTNVGDVYNVRNK